MKIKIFCVSDKRRKGAAENVDMEEVEPSCANVQEQGGALPVVGITPALAESTTGVEPAGEAERATTTNPTHWTPGCKAWPGAKSRGCHERVSRSSRCCRKRAGTKSRHCRERAGPNLMRRGEWT